MEKCICGLEFEKNSNSQKFCSIKCQKKHYNSDYYINNKINEIKRKREYLKTHPHILIKSREKRKITGMGIYTMILQRCNNKNNKAYKWYGGKGIKCIITKEEFIGFINSKYKCEMCSIVFDKTTKKTINSKNVDRINSEGHYEIGNLQLLCSHCHTKKDLSFFSNEQIEEIRNIYKKQSREFGSVALAKKYGCSSHNTILRIVRGK